MLPTSLFDLQDKREDHKKIRPILSSTLAFKMLGPGPSITDGVHRNENFVEIIPVFSTF